MLWMSTKQTTLYSCNTSIEKSPCHQGSLPRTLCSRVQCTNVTLLSRARVQHKARCERGPERSGVPARKSTLHDSRSWTGDEMDDPEWGNKSFVAPGPQNVGVFLLRPSCRRSLRLLVPINSVDVEKARAASSAPMFC